MSDLKNDIRPLEPSTMTDLVESRLREYLKRKSFVPGDALPKEQELADALGVSRNVVREALSRLRMLGMIDTRKKRGMLLAQPDILGSLERVLDPLLLGKNTLKDIFELRLVLEMGLADLLYLRKTPEDIAALEDIVAREVNNQQKPFRVEHEIAFHGKLYQMTGNDTYMRFQKMLLPVFEYVLDFEMQANGQADVGEVTHRNLVEILKTGDSEDFRRGMKAHLKPHFDRLKV
ncbi:DNA-binding FadR family transcriptional regulator [Dyadobacter sp. BE34]|uniref:DNA-binding FadR family transcriptional regulator n=1 Tax=Dyadobacter fermentans TaxID=94254 RepID=A0ABU1QVI6_9BACT|nr:MULTISPECIES: FCD domain-containing protein [Dyadobacter]MDR6805162.1 DNA-binding FadR family transcriptional regulator [Dyadobacter fermentans]MDR7043079.1 DNA-binding FadR family transcriptional regulator [Dyadobacter sp. BE242]MDR7197391.1 DNA-binding FadR family transcriptional regulator [Dyadobacter sp. BE34]MDR7215176.1 DNA-binding FadR family transcriptional regulator [Dyadobacter sp. BE31]MDR7262711.1 DNA-binding FadR family transcriptional regulator [Dyadobacter sp. BE32]